MDVPTSSVDNGIKRGILCLALICMGQESSAVTLREAFELAKSKYETIQSSDLDVQITKERKEQAFSNFLPRVDFNYRYLRQDVPSVGSGVSGQLRQPSQETAAFSLNQNLYRGGADAEFYEFTKLQSDVANERKREAEYLVYSQVAEIFYTTLAYESQLEVLKKLKKSTGDRVLEMKNRAKIGRNRRSDAYSSEAVAAAVDADILLTQTQLENSRRSLSVYVGESAFQKLEEKESALQPLLAKELYLEKVKQRPDLISARLNREMAEKNREVTEAGHQPNLDFATNYYLKRPGILTDSKWDFSFNFKMPLYAGGMVKSQVQSAQLQIQKSILELSRTEKMARLEIENNYNLFQILGERFEVLRKSRDLYLRSYNQINREYRDGIISYLDVSQPERDYWQSEIALLKAEQEAKVAYIKLLIAAGEL